MCEVEIKDNKIIISNGSITFELGENQSMKVEQDDKVVFDGEDGNYTIYEDSHTK